MSILITGVAGFIGSSVAHALLEKGEAVVGVDNLNDYYDVGLKLARLERLKAYGAFAFQKIDITDKDAMFAFFAAHRDATGIVHLAAQAGVRYSLKNPFAYIESNVYGHTVVMEGARNLPQLRHVVYASSSSVYGTNAKLPFSVADRVDAPSSLYAATKRSDELISHTYAHLYRIPLTGLRFFTVYGPWGRPDMAAYIFAKKIVAGEPIQVFNKGEMWRDFTFIDDIVVGVLSALAKPPSGPVPHRIFNLGNNRSERLLDYIGEIEKALGRKAVYEFLPMQPGDVPRTYADIESSKRELGYDPKTSIAEGVPRFIAWFKDYHKIG